MREVAGYFLGGVGTIVLAYAASRAASIAFFRTRAEFDNRKEEKL
jgi:hypothetical protein